MNNEDITSKIYDILDDQLGCGRDKISPTAHLRHDLGADSLDDVETIMYLEEEFDIEIDDEDATKWQTVADLTATVIGLVTARAGGAQA